MIQIRQSQNSSAIVRLGFAFSHTGGLHCRSMGLRHRTVSCNWPRARPRWVESKRLWAKQQSKSKPTWAEVKAKLAGFDRAALLDLFHSLYAAHKNNQAFLHARLGLGEDTLEPFKKTIHRWLRPDLSRRQDVSIAKAKRAISDYKKALGDPEGVAELMVFYCEQAVGFYSEVTYDDAGYLDALVRMFERALHTTGSLPANVQTSLIERLDTVRNYERRAWLWCPGRHGYSAFPFRFRKTTFGATN